VWAQVIGQRRDRHGRWCVGLRWYASPGIGGREGWFLYHPAKLRRPHGLPAGVPFASTDGAGWNVRTWTWLDATKRARLFRTAR
jgi:hypothetical protein